MAQTNISLERVIKGLECCTNQSVNCKAECPYYGAKPRPEMDCFDVVKKDALALLKVQEPRLITEADFENADEYGFIPVWCEVIGNTKDYWNCITIGALETAKEDGCRYWTAKPSLKQMEETPWK